MGSCGCGDGFGDFRLRAPDGWYVISLYAGCSSCGAPVGFSVVHYADEQLARYHVHHSRDVTDLTHDETLTGFVCPVCDWQEVIKQAEAEASDLDPGEYATAADLLHDLEHLLRLAANETIAKGKAKLRAAGPPAGQSKS